MASQQVWWKRVLKVQWPYQEKLRQQQLGHTLDVGCGIDRNLQVLPPGSIGTDTNPTSVEVARRRGLVAVLPEDLADDEQFDALLLAHLLEHLPASAAEAGARLPPASRGEVQIVCPQQRGYASDPPTCTTSTPASWRRSAAAWVWRTSEQHNFPFPTWAGKLFIYNEFWVRARYAGSSPT